MDFLEVTEGDGPVVLGLPHTGTDVPAAVRAALNGRGRALADTDWHVHRLYEGLLPDATTLRTRIHRYVIDVNRDPGGASLYPGQNTTGLVPLTDFTARPIWRHVPDAAEIEQRRQAFHDPYHRALARQLDRVRDRHGFALLYDCHSIRSRCPFLFEGVLPDFCIGDVDGRSCATVVSDIALATCAATSFSHVRNGRFRGGWTTRHHGRPADGIHAIQMEMPQARYLATEAPPFAYDPDKAAAVRAVLARLLARLAALTAAEVRGG